jgi:hypothetical protein
MMRKLMGLIVLVCGLVGYPCLSFSEIVFANIFITPSAYSDFFGGFIGGDGDTGTNTYIDWSIGNAVPFESSITNDMVFSTSTGDFMEPSNWEERMRITKEGNVGIGTDDPSEKLEVKGKVTAEAFVGDGSGLTNIPPGPQGPKGDKGDTGATGPQGSQGPQGPQGASPFGLNGNDAYYNAGSVGIGTTSPGAKLEVVENDSTSSDATAIRGEATATNNIVNYGGYFQAAGNGGRGVYGEATKTGDSVSNYGGEFKAAGQHGKGVLGYATGQYGTGVSGTASHTGDASNNKGGYFQAAGGMGVGVWGTATGTNGTGVIGATSGAEGKGVFGLASNTDGIHTSHGGYFQALGSYCNGVFGKASGTWGKGVYGYAPNPNGRGVYGYGSLWDFYAHGPGYGPFTGGHEVRLSESFPDNPAPGMVVSVTGQTEVRKDKDGIVSISSTLPTVKLSSVAQDRAVFGVFVSESPLAGDHWYKAGEGERFGTINALGEGRVWITNQNGEIQAGDYITTSVISGYGQRQDDDLLHSYTLGKAIETIDWDSVIDTVAHNGETYKAYLIAVVYTSG